jgi:Ion transport protein
VFIVFANDGWSRIYLSFYKFSGFLKATFYFVSLLVIGQYLILNLLVAIIIENFEYLSVKNDLINKIKNMKREEEAQKLTFWQRFHSAICFYRKKSL